MATKKTEIKLEYCEDLIQIEGLPSNPDYTLSISFPDEDDENHNLVILVLDKDGGTVIEAEKYLWFDKVSVKIIDNHRIIVMVSNNRVAREYFFYVSGAKQFGLSHKTTTEYRLLNKIDTIEL